MVLLIPFGSLHREGIFQVYERELESSTSILPEVFVFI